MVGLMGRERRRSSGDEMLMLLMMRLRFMMGERRWSRKEAVGLLVNFSGLEERRRGADAGHPQQQPAPPTAPKFGSLQGRILGEGRREYKETGVSISTNPLILPFPQVYCYRAYYQCSSAADYAPCSLRLVHFMEKLGPYVGSIKQASEHTTTGTDSWSMVGYLRVSSKKSGQDCISSFSLMATYPFPKIPMTTTPP